MWHVEWGISPEKMLIRPTHNVNVDVYVCLVAERCYHSHVCCTYVHINIKCKCLREIHAHKTLVIILEKPRIHNCVFDFIMKRTCTLRWNMNKSTDQPTDRQTNHSKKKKRKKILGKKRERRKRKEERRKNHAPPKSIYCPEVISKWQYQSRRQHPMQHVLWNLL